MQTAHSKDWPYNLVLTKSFCPKTQLYVEIRWQRSLKAHWTQWKAVQRYFPQKINKKKKTSIKCQLYCDNHSHIATRKSKKRVETESKRKKDLRPDSNCFGLNPKKLKLWGWRLMGVSCRSICDHTPLTLRLGASISRLTDRAAHSWIWILH